MSTKPSSVRSSFHLLVVEDDSFVVQGLKLVLPAHWKLFHIDPKNLFDHKVFFHAALVDMHLGSPPNKPGLAEGPGHIKALAQKHPSLEIIAISGDPSLELMEKSLAAGARRFLQKPISKEELLSCLEKIEAHWLLRELESRGRMGPQWIGSSALSKLVKSQIAELKGEEGPVLIEGETGTGKEVCVRLLNQQEMGRPLISVNVAALTETLFESELFGHVKGAFTGADQQKIGLVEVAHGGDLFLDEVEALSPSQQVKLLRFLESSEYRKVGGKELQISQARVLAASNQPLKNLVKEGRFREDLYFRLARHQLKLPPLRDRREDIQELAEFFLEQQAPRVQKKWSKEALDLLQQYSWPGNVRELKRVIEQAAVKAPLPILRSVDLDLDSQVEARTSLVEASLEEQLLAHEKVILKDSLKKTRSIEEAAQRLKISRSSMYKKLKDHNLSGEESPE